MKLKKDDAEKINDFMNTLEHPFKAEVEALRVIIRNVNSKIAERIKWNAPSYYYQTDMAAFNLHQKKFVQLILIFPKGLINDGTGLLKGDWKDRREARFYNMEDIESKKAALEKIITEWVELMEK